MKELFKTQSILPLPQLPPLVIFWPFCLVGNVNIKVHCLKLKRSICPLLFHASKIMQAEVNKIIYKIDHHAVQDNRNKTDL
jgi:hypothetical protein